MLPKSEVVTSILRDKLANDVHYRIELCESERGWGSNSCHEISWYEYYPTRREAEERVREIEAAYSGRSTVSDYYIVVVEGPTEIVRQVAHWRR